jgi:hypothetical protein
VSSTPPSRARILVWVVAAGVGAYLIIDGLFGLMS